MKVTHVFLGFLLALVCTFIGGVLYVQFAAGFNLFTDFNLLIENGLGGKVIAIGSLLNIPLVYFLMNKHKYEIGKGVIAGLIILVVVSQFV